MATGEIPGHGLPLALHRGATRQSGLNKGNSAQPSGLHQVPTQYCPECGSQRIWKDIIVYIRYRDHVLFRNADSSFCKPSIRETVGWIAKENDEAVLVLWDRSCVKLPHETAQRLESGLVVLKSDILEMKKVG